MSTSHVLGIWIGLGLGVAILGNGAAAATGRTIQPARATLARAGVKLPSSGCAGRDSRGPAGSARTLPDWKQAAAPLRRRGGEGSARKDAVHRAAGGASLITLQVRPGSEGGPLGPDGKHHDAFVPSNLKVPVGKVVTVRIVNYDMMEHSIYQPELGLDIVARPAAMEPDGRMVPITTTATFSVRTRGRYRWFCTRPCDDDAGGWAMAPGAAGSQDAGRPGKDGFMAGEIVAF